MSNSRNEKIFHLIDKSGLGLEIGPSYNPIAPKRDGWNVEIADHLDAASLRSKYAAWGVDGSAIEEVDYVVGSGGLFTAIGEESRFDFILASHAIEHMPDVVQFLVDCEKLLKPGGILSLVVPDKRFCFDVLKPLTTTGQILQAHIERRSKHSPGTIFDAHALHVKNNEAIVWPENRNVNDLKFVHSVAEAKKIMDDYIEHGQFLDVHAWQFIPASFEMLISDLIEMKLLKLELVASFDTVGYEFFVSLCKSGVPSRVVERDRISLAKLAAAAGVATIVQPVPAEGTVTPKLGLATQELRHFFQYKSWVRRMYLSICQILRLP
jgi:SAM-dependent methyltransferase